MAWTTPGTATAGEVLTAAFWNANVRDNSNSLRDVTGVVPAMCKVIRTSDLTAPASGGAFTWNSAEIDTATMWSAGAPTLVTIQTSGVYQISAAAYILNTTTYTTAPTLRVSKNGSAVAAQGMGYQNGGFVSITATISTLISATASDTITLGFTYGSGGTLTVKGDLAVGRTEMSVRLIGRTT